MRQHLTMINHWQPYSNSRDSIAFLKSSSLSLQCFRLLFLSLISTALAAPQFYSSYDGYPMYGYSYPSIYPGAPPGHLLYPGATQQFVHFPRGFFKFENLLEIKGEFATDANTIPARTVEGTYLFQQNIATDPTYGNNIYFQVYIKGTTDLTGKNVVLAFGSDCTNTGMVYLY